MTVFSTCYFPTLAYVHALMMEEVVVIDSGEHYKKQTKRNRCSILSANGSFDLSIPVIKPFGNKTSTKDIEVSTDAGWRRDHFRSIQAAYSNAPYWDDYQEQVHSLLFQKSRFLIDFNAECMQQIAKWLELKMDYTLSEKYIENPIKDFRNFDFQTNGMSYIQVLFSQQHFVPNLSILDALFCIGPMTRNLIIPPTKLQTKQIKIA